MVIAARDGQVLELQTESFAIKEQHLIIMQETVTDLFSKVKNLVFQNLAMKIIPI